MKLDYQTFNELLNIDSSAALQRALRKIIADVGFDKFAYYSELKNEGNEAPTVLSNYPDEWLAHYVVNDYENIDPVHIAAKNTLLPIQWGSDEYIKRLNHRQRKFYNEAAKYSICAGLTIPIHFSGGLATLTVASSENNAAFQKRTQKYISLIHLLALHFHEAIQKIPTNQPTNQPTN